MRLKYLWGKLIGALLGGLILKIPGAIVGLLLGGFWDYWRENKGVLYDKSPAIGATNPDDFVVASILLAAEVVKSDGEVDDLELSYVRTFLLEQFGSEYMEAYWTILERAIGEEVKLKPMVVKLRDVLGYETRLQLIFFLFGIANADYTVDQSEIDTIHRISTLLRVEPTEYTSIKAMFYDEMDAYYKILEIKPSVSDKEVKYAFEALCEKYSPDHVAYLGVGVKEAAIRKQHRIENAYITILRERGIKVKSK
jgi:DnaJ like chaperone protein